MKPLISIIIPIFNVEKYIDQCLESVVMQDFSDFEVYCINDATPDRSIEIVERYMKYDKRILLLNHSTNLGLPSSRNTGIKNASGEYLFFLDSDDWIAPQTISTLYHLTQIDNVDIAMGGVIKCFDGSGKCYPANHSKYMKKNLHSVTIFNHPEIFHSVVSCNKMIRSEFLKKTNLLFNPEPRRFEDILTYKWYLEGATVSLDTNITYFYRQRSENESNPSILQEKDQTVVRDKLLMFIDITKYVVKNGYFDTIYNPLNSKYSPINLSKALAWMIPQMCDIPNRKLNILDEKIETFNVFKKLCQKLTEKYIGNLPKKIQKAVNIAREEKVDLVIDRISRLYRKI